MKASIILTKKIYSLSPILGAVDPLLPLLLPQGAVTTRGHDLAIDYPASSVMRDQSNWIANLAIQCFELRSGDYRVEPQRIEVQVSQFAEPHLLIRATILKLDIGPSAVHLDKH